LWKFQQHYALPGEVPAVGELSTRQFDSELHLQAKYVFITCMHLKQTFRYDVCRSYSNFDMTSADDWCDQNLRAVNLDFKNSFCSQNHNLEMICLSGPSKPTMVYLGFDCSPSCRSKSQLPFLFSTLWQFKGQILTMVVNATFGNF